MNKTLWIVVIILGAITLHQYKQVEYANQQWETASANVKMYNEELSAEKQKSTAYQLTIDQLKYYKDSVLVELNQVRKELGIKDKNLQSIQYISSVFAKTDTITLKDTLFRDNRIEVDTLLGDAWYKVKIGLKYPSRVTVTPEFKSDKYIVVSTKRETVNPPKKFFLFRWFQKKHTVLNVDVVEQNPYVKNEKSRFIEIIK